MEWIKEHKFYLLAGIAASLVFVYSSYGSENDLTEQHEEVVALDEGEEVENKDIPERAEESLIIMADIKGAVVNPGVYEFQDGSRVIDLIELAGGLAKDADSATINFAMHVKDEMVIYVPRIGEQVEAAVNIQTGQPTSGKAAVNLNTAEASELETLPGIGPAKAEAIIEHRETNGPYKSIEDLKLISGIGDKTFDKLKELISVK
jgi:competence protein ComEA